MRRPQHEIESELAAMANALVRGPRTIEWLVEYLGVSRATVWRRLKDLEQLGYKLVRLGPSRPTRYRIIT